MSFLSWLQSSQPREFSIEDYLSKGSEYALYRGRKFIYVPSGSYHTCYPRVEDTDIDYFVFYPHLTWEQAKEELISYGLEPYDAEYEEWNIHSFRAGKYNIILCLDADTFVEKRTATAICRELNLLSKEDRIRVFASLSGSSYGMRSFYDAYGRNPAYESDVIIPTQEDLWAEVSVSTLTVPRLR